MFCMNCGQKLPDDAQFCYKCGCKTVSEADMATEKTATQEVTTEPAKNPIAQGAPNEEPPHWEEIPHEERPPKIKKERGAKSSKKKSIAIIGGVAAALVVILVAVILAVSGGNDETEIPDPEYYFALPLSDSSRSDGMISYTIKANDLETDLSDEVYAYIDTLCNDYDFMITNNEEDNGYINTHLMGIGDSSGEVEIYYQHDYFDHQIVVTTTPNIRLIGGVSYDGGSSDEIVEESETENDNIYTDDPAVLPDFAEVDSTGTFSYFTSFFHTEYEDRLFTSYISKDIFAVYEVNHYIEILCDMGYVVDRIDEDNQYFLYHPDVNAPSLPGEKAQICVLGHINSDGTSAFMSITMPKEICIKGYENKYQEMKEWHENREANRDSDSSSSGNSSSGNSSSGNSSSGGSSFNEDLYDNDPICGVCNGDGDCSKCGGSGYLHSSASDEKDRNCYRCNGSGRCGSCGGDGRL